MLTRSRFGQRAPTALTSLALGLLAMGAHLQEAEACSLASGWSVNIPGEVQVDGMLVASARCDFCPTDATLTFTVNDSDGVPVPGTIVEELQRPDASTWVAWKPSEPLTEGESYGVVWTGNVYVAEPTFLAVAVEQPSATLAVARTELAEVVSVQGETHCCLDELSSCGPACYTIAESTTTDTRLKVSMTEQSDAEVFLTQLRYDTPEGTLATDWTTTTEYVVTMPLQAELCYTLVQRSPGDDTETVIADECLTDAKPANVEQAIDAALETIAYCREVEASDFELWCGQFEAEILAGVCPQDGPYGCDSALAACAFANEGDDIIRPPLGPNEEDDDESDTGGDGRSTDDSSTGDDGQSGDDSSSDESSGCSAHPTPTQGAPWLLLTGLLGLLAIRRRSHTDH